MTTGTTPETSKGNFFTLRNVKITPAVPAVAQEIKVTGDIYLFGIPFLALSWVTCDIKIPKADLDITNPVIHIESMAYGGHFSLAIKGGVSRQGLCSALVQLYAGPTYKENLAGPGGIGLGGILTLPPFSPVVATVPPISFTVSGTLTQDFTVGTPGVQGEYLTGGAVQLDSLITNTTDVDTAVSIQLQVYNQGNILGITYNGNTVTNATIGPITIPAGEHYAAAWQYIEGPSPGSRDIIITVLDVNKAIVGQGTFNGLYQVVNPLATKLTVSPSTIVVGDTLQFEIDGFASAELVNFTVSGSPTVLASFTTNDVGTDIDSFVYEGPIGAVVLVATGVTSGKSAQASLTVNSPSGAGAKITVSPNAIAYGGNINITLTGFPDNIPVTIWIVLASDPTPNGAGSVVEIDASGNGAITEVNDLPTAGSYLVIDGNGHQAAFTTTSGFPTVPTIQSVSTAITGGVITIGVLNFKPNATLTASLPNGDRATTVSDSTGDGIIYLTTTESPGTYVLTVTDGTNTVTATATVLPSNVTVSFTLEIEAVSYYMSGTSLSTYPGVPVTSWTCSYYDPVTRTLTKFGTITLPEDNCQIANVNPGGYVVVTMTSSNGTTSPIQSEIFAPANGDVWLFNVYLAAAGQGNNIELASSIGTGNLITINPSSITQNSAGTPLNFTLSGFTPGSNVVVSNSDGENNLTLTTDSSGTASGTFTVKAPVGTYTLIADGPGFGLVFASYSVVKSVSNLPVITLPSNTVQVNSYLAFNVSGFPASEQVSVELSSGELINITVNSQGAGSGQFPFVSGQEGSYTITAFDAAGNRTNPVDFTVTAPVLAPAITVSNSPINPGGQLAFTVSNFPANEYVTVAVIGGGGQSTSVLTGINGSVSGVIIDENQPGSYSLQASDISGNTASTPFSIVAAPGEITATISPAGGGSITYSPNIQPYTIGETVTITAVPASGYTFDYWQLPNEQTTENPYPLVVSADTIITAYFTQGSSPPPTGGTTPTSTAPTGDTEWFYVVFIPDWGTVGEWYDQTDFNNLEVQNSDYAAENNGVGFISNVFGPYAPGSNTGY
jgi:hypothetical protein